MTNPQTPGRLGADPAGSLSLAAYRFVRDLCAAVLASGYEPDPGLLLGAARVRPLASEEDLAGIPAAGPVLVAACAAYGTLEALAASFLLEEARPDVKVWADPFVAAAPNLRPRFIACDPWDSRRGAPANVRAARQALAWLRSGGLLAAFVEDGGWTAAARLARLGEAAIVPAAVMRQAPAVPENGTVELRLSAPVGSERLSRFAAAADAAAYLRWRARELCRRHQPALRLVPRLAAAADTNI